MSGPPRHAIIAGMDDAAYERESAVQSVGLGLEELSGCLAATISWLRDRGIDPQSLGIDDIRFCTVETPRGPGIEARIRLQALLADQLPVAYEGFALEHRFTFTYGENLLQSASFVAVERPDGGWLRRGGSGRSLTGPDGRANS